MSKLIPCLGDSKRQEEGKDDISAKIRPLFLLIKAAASVQLKGINTHEPQPYFTLDIWPITSGVNDLKKMLNVMT